MVERYGWDYLLDRMLVDAVRCFFQSELQKRRMFPLTELSVDLSDKYGGLDVPVGKRFFVDVAGIDADIFSYLRPRVNVLVEVESSKNSKLQIENNKRKLALLSKDFGCASLQVKVPSLDGRGLVDEIVWKKIEKLILDGRVPDDYMLEKVSGASLFFINPTVELGIGFSSYPKGFRKFTIPKERLSWWLEHLLGYSFGKLAGRVRHGDFYRKVQALWNIGDAEFLAKLQAEESDFSVMAVELRKICRKIGVMSISSEADFFRLREGILFSQIVDDDVLFRKWHRMEDERLRKVIDAGVRDGLFCVGKDGEWDVI